MSKIDELRLGFETAYIDGSVVSNNIYRPQFVSNNHKEGKKVLSSIEDELLVCDGFQISVAFITMNGITPLLQTLKELEKRNIKGEILTTNYLNFSEPKALKKLNELSNITLKMYDVEVANEGFHTKGYIFRKEEIYHIIIGSSNITSAALTDNREWNTKLVSTVHGETAKEIVTEFNELWNSNYALTFDEFYENYNIRRCIMEGGRVIPGASTVHFDEISRKRIFASVDNANFSDIKLIKENYTNLKNKLGRIPRLHDFDDYGEMDVMRIFDNNSLGSYYKFLVKYEKEYKIRLSEDEEKVIEFVSKKLANGKRIQELQILKRILTYAHGLSKIGLFAGLSEDMREYGKNISQDQKENIVNVMTNKFPAGASKKTYSQCVFMEQEGNDYKPTKLFMQMLANDEFYGVLQELVDFGISRYERDYKNTYDQTDLVLYQKYTYEDVCRLLNWEQNEVPLNIGGYKFDKKTKTFPVFINYDKAEDISDTTKYEDHFIPGFRDRLIAISKSGRNLQSEDVQNFLKAKERGIQVELFVRKNKDDKVSKEFYYLGHMTASGNIKEFTMTNTEKTAVEIEWILDVPVREDIYEYIVNS